MTIVRRKGIKRSHICPKRILCFLSSKRAQTFHLPCVVLTTSEWWASQLINIASSYLSVFNIASSSSTSSILHHHQYCIILSQCYRNHFLGKAPTMIDNSICLQTFGSKGRFHLIEYDMRNILINNQFHYNQYDIWRIEFRFKNKSRISAKCEQNAIDICSRLAVAW